jgi:hypothetical protein
MTNDVILYEGDLPVIAREAQKVLSKKTPKSAIYTRPGPYGKALDYTPWAWVAQQLNKAFGPAWSIKYIADPKMDGGEVLVMIELSTPLGFQQAFGSHKYQLNNPNASYGDALQSATSKALRRAAARWGIGLDLYLGDTDNGEMLEEEKEEWAKLVEKSKESSE